MNRFIHTLYWFKTENHLNMSTKTLTGTKTSSKQTFKIVICSRYGHVTSQRNSKMPNRGHHQEDVSPPKALDEIQPNLVCELLT